MSPDGRNAYVANGFLDDDTVSQYGIDPVTGALSPKTPPTVAAGRAPLGVAVSPDGRSAYVTNQFSSNISQYTIVPATGALVPKAPPTVSTSGSPNGIALTPDGRSAYVANGSGVPITQYDVDPATGALSPKTPPAVNSVLAPSDVAVTPDGRSAYVTNSGFGLGTGVSQFDIHPTTGTLTPKAPPTVASGLGPGFVAVTPDGASAYVTNFNGSSISQYTVAAGSGALVPKTPPAVPTAAQPADIAVRAAPAAPTSKDQCKHGGWRDFPALGFKNQGDCVSYVATKGKNPPGRG